MNKIDTIKKDELLECIAAYKDMMEFAEIIPVSAWTGENVDELITTMFSYLEEGPAFYDEDTNYGPAGAPDCGGIDSRKSTSSAFG